MRHGNAPWDDTTNPDHADRIIPLKQTHKLLYLRADGLGKGMGKVVCTYFQDNNIWSKVPDHVKVIFFERLHSATANAMQVNRRCTTKVKVASRPGIKTQLQIALKAPYKRMA